MHVVATAGHVDHGKSALVRALTGQEPDRFDEERRRGLTIDLGFVWTDLDDGTRQVTTAFVDVPGHDRFLTNMLTGVGAVDEVLFVVAADDGWSAQSQEHLDIVALLGRRIVTAVVTKTGPAGPDRTAEVTADVRARLDAVGFQATPIVAVDSLAGTGLDQLRTTLVAALSASTGTADGFARLWVDRVFTVAGAGTVVTGTLTSGHLARQQQLAVLPGPARGRIRELRALERPRDEVTAPARVAVALAGVDSEAVVRGDTLTELRDDGTPAALTTTVLDVWLQVLPDAEVTGTGAWQLHLGSAHRDVRVLPLLGALGPGQDGPVRLQLDRPVAARSGDRIVLSEVGRRRTVAGGEVLDVAPGRPPRGTERRLIHAEALDTIRGAPTPVDRAAGLIDAHAGSDRLDRLDRLEAMLGHTLPAIATLEGLDRLGPHVVRAAAAERWAGAMAATARAAHDPVLTRDAVRRAAQDAGCPEQLDELLLRAAITDGQLHDVGGRVVHDDRIATYRADRERRQQALLDRLRDEPFAPAALGEVAGDHALPFFEVQPLIDDGRLFVRDGLLFPAEVVATAVTRLDAGPAAGGDGFTASDARQCWEVSRRVAVPLLEHLKATGHTTFDGTHHHRARTGGR